MRKHVRQVARNAHRNQLVLTHSFSSSDDVDVDDDDDETRQERKRERERFCHDGGQEKKEKSLPCSTFHPSIGHVVILHSKYKSKVCSFTPSPCWHHTAAHQRKTLGPFLMEGCLIFPVRKNQLFPSSSSWPSSSLLLLHVSVVEPE